MDEPWKSASLDCAMGVILTGSWLFMIAICMEEDRKEYLYLLPIKKSRSSDTSVASSEVTYRDEERNQARKGTHKFPHKGGLPLERWSPYAMQLGAYTKLWVGRTEIECIARQLMQLWSSERSNQGCKVSGKLGTKKGSSKACFDSSWKVKDSMKVCPKH